MITAFTPGFFDLHLFAIHSATKGIYTNEARLVPS